MRCVLAVLAALAALSLAGCGYVPVTTLYKLWSFDLLHADPAQIRAAARYPDALAPRPGGAKLLVTIKSGERSDVRTFVLEDDTNAAELAAVAKYRRAGFSLRVFRLAATDVALMRSVLKDLREAKARGDKATGSLGISVDACHMGVLPKQAVLTSSFLKLDTAAGYMTLLEDVDLRKEFGDNALAERVPPCSKG